MGNWTRKFGGNLRTMVGAALLAVTLIALLAFASPRLERYFLLQSGEEQSATLRLALESLRSTLERYAPIPNLIAARPAIRDVLADPDNEALKQSASRLLEETAIALRASGIYLEDPSGNPILAIPAIERASNEGGFSYRPYFSETVAGGLGQYFALGTPTGERGFFYAAPVRSLNRIEGVIAVKFAVDQFEATWRQGRAEIIVRDANDIVFMSSRPEWNFRSMSPIPEDRMRLISAARQFPSDQLVPLPNKKRQLTENFDIIEISDGEEEQSYISSTSLIARAGWRVTILTPTSDAFALARTAIVIIALIFTLLVLAGALLLQRRARIAERYASQQAAQELLERRVKERTSELNTANTQLVAEIEERKTAEKRLRKTQTDLIQAGKLAALGQMSAALSHELNQPLAATKAYAENAITFMKRDRHDDAANNVRQISSLTDRMSSIAKHLRNFARRPQEKLRPVVLQAILDDAFELMKPKLASSGTTLNCQSEADLWVVGGQVRLQQVFVNLVSNAVDAMTGKSPSQIDVSVLEDNDHIHVDFRDYGDGLSDESMALLFDPFFTTKDPGKGLGLGLSISYNIIRDFGGKLSARNHPDGGAVFRVTLRRTEQNEVVDEQAEAAE